jgi:hypothetical protein
VSPEPTKTRSVSTFSSPILTNSIDNPPPSSSAQDIGFSVQKRIRLPVGIFLTDRVTNNFYSPSQNRLSYLPPTRRERTRSRRNSRGSGGAPFSPKSEKNEGVGVNFYGFQKKLMERPEHYKINLRNSGDRRCESFWHTPKPTILRQSRGMNGRLPCGQCGGGQLRDLNRKYCWSEPSSPLAIVIGHDLFGLKGLVASTGCCISCFAGFGFGKFNSRREVVVLRDLNSLAPLAVHGTTNSPFKELQRVYPKPKVAETFWQSFRKLHSSNLSNSATTTVAERVASLEIGWLRLYLLIRTSLCYM